MCLLVFHRAPTLIREGQRKIHVMHVELTRLSRLVTYLGVSNRDEIKAYEFSTGKLLLSFFKLFTLHTQQARSMACCEHAPLPSELQKIFKGICRQENEAKVSGISHPHALFMERAIELSRIAGLEKRTGGCFGAVVVKDGKIVGEGYNNVISHNDPTWHGEVGAIRDASARLGTPHLRGCVLYTSSEPCPMCMGACYWARIDKVYYATTAKDVKEHGRFEDEDFYLEFAKPPADRIIPAVEFMRTEAIKVWEEFSQMPDKCHY